MADRPVVPSKKNELAMRFHTELDYPKHRHSPLDADHFYDCMEEIEPQDYTKQPPVTTNPLSLEENIFNRAFTVNFIHSAEMEENSDGQKTGSTSDEEELSEVLKKLLQYGEEIRACARQCGIDAESFHCMTPECTGTEPCLEPFVAGSGTLEPTPRGDIEHDAEENERSDSSRSTLASVYFGVPGEEGWCSASSSPRSVTNSETPALPIDTIQNLRLNNLEEYCRVNPDKGNAQLPQSGDKQERRCMKKSKSDSEVLLLAFQKSEDEEGYETDSDSSGSSSSSSSSSSSEIERQQSSTDWSTLSCHTISCASNGSTDSLTGGQDDDAYADDIADDLEGRPDAAGDGGASHLSIHVTEEDEGIYEFDLDEHLYLTPDSGDRDSNITYNCNLPPQNRPNPPLRLTLTTEEMLDELFPAVRLQPRPVRILQNLPDHPVSENTSGGGEGDFELGRRIVVQGFFVEDASRPQEETDRSWISRPAFDINRNSLQEILCWTTLAGFCASVFFIWQFHHSSR